MYVSGSVHKWGCVCLCAGVHQRALAPVCVRLRVCYLYRESPLSLSLSLSLCTQLCRVGVGVKNKPDGRFLCKKKNPMKFFQIGLFNLTKINLKYIINALGENKDSINNLLDCLVQLLFFLPFSIM